ncbi:transmembrane protein [Ceratobasidium sp. AG-Ba]|nr:transmembrane protein [Ceratobasidium sp. AG-Ba]
MARGLTERPLELVYFVYFLMHVPATLLIDAQGIMPPNILPESFRKLVNFYVNLSGDPLIAGAIGLHGSATQFTWFHTFVAMECLFQLPAFLIGMSMLKRESPYLPILLVMYGAHVTTTVVPALTTVLATPRTTAEILAEKGPFQSMTQAQVLMFLSSYLPFLIMPLIMMIDGSMRLVKLVQRNLALEKTAKRL